MLIPLKSENRKGNMEKHLLNTNRRRRRKTLNRGENHFLMQGIYLDMFPLWENHWIEALQVMAPWLKGVPHAVANMKKLRWLSCYDYPATSLPRNFQSTKLFYLQLGYSQLEQLWEGDKVLDLYGSKFLIRTPNFDGLPSLEKIRFNHCDKLAYIDPSISHHERLISVEMEYCTELKEFPPISGMKNLETLLLSGCDQLCVFPEIQMNMDNMKELSLDQTGIKVVPSSIGQYCTNLVSLDFRGCKSLESIESNFHLLKHLKEFYINDCQELKIPTKEGLFDVKGCLKVLYFYDISFKNLHPGIKFLDFPSSLRKLSLVLCNWINGDMSSILCELPNLQVLDLSHNTFSRLNCSLLQLPSLKLLDLSDCDNLVELPDLPSSIAFLKADGCLKLKIVDLPTNLKWLWRISVPIESISGDVDIEVQSMLQGNAYKDYSTSLSFYGYDLRTRAFARGSLVLKLPRNWYNEFSGFLLCTNANRYRKRKTSVITIKDVMGCENENVLEASKKTSHDMCYIYLSFGSLRHTSWWNSTTHTTISFSMEKCTWLKVELVSRISEGDSIEKVKDTTNSSEFWDKEPLEIKHDSETCIEILWYDDENKMGSLFDNSRVSRIKIPRF